MTFAELYTNLKNITGFSNKVAYRQFPQSAAPELPFIVYYVENSDNFGADNKVYLQKNEVTIELYTKNKDVTSEGLVEKMLNDNDIFWNKYEEYIESEHMYQISYDITI